MRLPQLGAEYTKTCNVWLLGVSVCQKGGIREASWHLEAELHSIAQSPAMVKGKENGKNGGIQKVMISRTLKYTLATAILLAVMLVVTVVPVATAKTDTADNQAKLVTDVAIEKMIEKLEPFVTRCDDGTFRLDIPKDAKIDKPSAEFKTVSAAMEGINELIREGELVSTPDLSVYSASDGRFALQSNNRNEFKWRWYGFEFWIDHNVCRYVVEATSIGAIAAELTAFLGVPLPLATAIAAVLGIGAIIVSNNDNGCGTHLKFYWQNPLYPPVLFYASPQTCD
jgi:hypothetical protein